MANPPPKFEIGQPVAVYCIPTNDVFPVTTVIDREFRENGSVVIGDDGNPQRLVESLWGYEVEARRGWFYPEKCLRPLDPDDYRQMETAEELEQC